MRVLQITLSMGFWLSAIGFLTPGAFALSGGMKMGFAHRPWVFETLHTFSYPCDQINSKTADRLICLFRFAMVSVLVIQGNFKTSFKPPCSSSAMRVR